MGVMIVTRRGAHENENHTKLLMCVDQHTRYGLANSYVVKSDPVVTYYHFARAFEDSVNTGLESGVHHHIKSLSFVREPIRDVIDNKVKFLYPVAATLEISLSEYIRLRSKVGGEENPFPKFTTLAG